MLEDLESKLALKKNWLVYDITATIPYTSLSISFDTSQVELLETVKHVVVKVEAATNQRLVLRTNKFDQDDYHLTSSSYICHQDKASHRKKDYKKASTFKYNNCKSSYLFKFRRNYNFINITLQHAIHHDTLKKTEIPAGLEEIISSQNCYQFSNLMDLLVKNGGFSEYLNNATSTETNEIKRFWNKHVESRWIRDDDALISAGKLLSDGTLNHVKLLELKESTTNQESMPSLAIYFDYGNIDKSLFTKAAVDATYNPSQNLKQCFVVVGELNGEGYPLAALFS